MDECIECLPNEIFIEIFQYLDARLLFQAFYNLNSRFNSLLKSLENCLAIPTNDPRELELFYPYIRSLIIIDEINIPLYKLINLRRVVLHTKSSPVFDDFIKNITSNIEHLTILYPHLWLLGLPIELTQKIFSNRYPHLKSSCLPQRTMLSSTEGWTQSPSLRILKMGWGTFASYAAILASCRNLYSLQFWVNLRNRSTISTETHVNLKRMIVNLIVNGSLSDDWFDGYLSIVPKLEQLTIDLILYDSNSIEFVEDYDWFASAIDRYLPMLQRFHCYVTIHKLMLKIPESEHGNLMNKFKPKFERVHNDRYQSKLVVRFQNKLL